MQPYLGYHRFRRFLRNWSERGLFRILCQEYKIRIASPTDARDIAVFKDIFLDKAYADYFPGYREARIVDVGAHKGFFTLFAARHTAPGARILAVEPSADNFSALEANIAANGLEGSVTALRAALADRAGRAQLRLSAAENHSLLASPGPRNVPAPPGETVETATLAGLLDGAGWDTADFLKLDCEGSEYPALYASSPATLARVGVISMEFHDLQEPGHTALDMARFLGRNGFEVVKVRHETTRHALLTGKLVAVRN